MKNLLLTAALMTSMILANAQDVMAQETPAKRFDLDVNKDRNLTGVTVNAGDTLLVDGNSLVFLGERDPNTSAQKIAQEQGLPEEQSSSLQMPYGHWSQRQGALMIFVQDKDGILQQVEAFGELPENDQYEKMFIATADGVIGTGINDTPGDNKGNAWVTIEPAKSLKP